MSCASARTRWLRTGTRWISVGNSERSSSQSAHRDAQPDRPGRQSERRWMCPQLRAEARVGSFMSSQTARAAICCRGVRSGRVSQAGRRAARRLAKRRVPRQASAGVIVRSNASEGETKALRAAGVAVAGAVAGAVLTPDALVRQPAHLADVDIPSIYGMEIPLLMGRI